MAKNHTSSLTIVETLLIIVTVIAVNRVFDWFITKEYIELIEKKGLIEAFYSGGSERLQKVKEQYRIEYLTLERDTVIRKSNYSLPTIQPIVIEKKRSGEVLPYDYKELLKKMRPYIVLQRSGLLIGFPLLFESQERQYVVFHKILP